MTAISEAPSRYWMSAPVTFQQLNGVAGTLSGTLGHIPVVPRIIGLKHQT